MKDADNSVPEAKGPQQELIFNHSSDPTFLIGVEKNGRYRFITVNSAFLHISKLTREQVEGKYADEVIPVAFHNQIFTRYTQAIQERQNIQWEDTADYPDGLRTTIISITPVFNVGSTILVGTLHDITELKKLIIEKDRIAHSLNERVKELTTVYRVDQLFKSTDQPVEETLQSFVSILPPGWQYPSITEARISLGDQQFATPGFDAAVESQSADFLTPDGKTGKIEVAYTEKTTQEAEGPFLKEERNMINLLAEMLRIYLTRKEEAAQLLKEKKLTESIMNSMPGIFYLFDSDGQYHLWNKNHETITGYSAEEMKLMHPLMFVAEEDKQLIEEKMGKVFTDGYADVEAGFLLKNREIVPYFFNGKAIDYNGKPCILGVGLDITEPKKMEKGLREAEIKFRTLVEKSQVGVYIVQRGKYVYVNPRFAEIFGYTQDELIGEDPVLKIIDTEYQAISRENIRARMDNEVESVHYEVNGKKKDGTINRIEFFGSRTLYEGQPTIIGTMVDITESKLAQEALKKSEANLKTIFDNTDTIYVLLDTNFQIISYNQRAADFAVKELHRTYKVSSNLLDFVADERKNDLHTLMKKVVSGESVQYENSYLQPDGSTNWYYARVYPIRDNNENIFGLMFAVSDITEKKLLEQKIVDQKVQEQKKMIRAVLNGQEKERNKIGQELHDNVNQILAGAKMYLGYLKDKNLEHAQTIQQSIDLLDSAIDEIRSLTREQVTPQRKIDLKDHIQSLVDNLNTHSAVRTIFNYDTGKFYINEDLKINIYRIVQEGINNILKHSAATTVTINVKADESGLHILIDDNGKGFSASAPVRGTGITNIMNRVDSYNGKAIIESSLGKGCRIAITTPL